MKNILILACLLSVMACQKEDPIRDISIYECNLTFADDSDNHPKAARFESAMQKVQSIVPGLQIAVRSKDGNVWLGAQGLADIPNQAPFEKCTKTMVGSLSKVYTAVTIMQLHDENILSIDNPISDWLDATMVSKIENADKATIRNLLNHDSGIKDYLSTEHHINSLNTPFFQISPEEKIEYIYGKSAEFPVGEKYSYSNSNYVLLGIIAAKARNMPFEKVINDYIVEPLGLQITGQGTTDNPIPDDCARSYLAFNNHDDYVETMQFSVADAATGDGGIYSNTQEVLTFIEALFNNELVSPEALDMMTNEKIASPNQRRIGDQVSYGLGLEIVENSQYGQAIGHAGSTSGYWTNTYHFPSNGVTFTIAFNGDTESEEYDKLLDLTVEIIDIAAE